ncbi:MAG: hypothetical protein JRJ38_19695 [Deltaproteobacteria bacterium]|nr:hypothetical protein [Deltaproteobacteria bacterium]
MAEILWHRRETRRQTEKTNLGLEPWGRLRFEQSNLIVMQESAEGILSRRKRALTDAPNGRGK